MAEEKPPRLVLQDEGAPDPIGPISRAKRDHLSACVGAAISAFAYVETNLLLLFAECMGLPPEAAARLLAPIKTFSLSLSVIDVAVRHKVTPLGALPYWTSLHEFILELTGDRNYLAHTGVIFHGPGQPSQTTDESLEPKIGPAINSHLMGDVRREPMPIGEVTELIYDFDLASKLVQHLQLALSQPLPEIFFRPIVRRRPSRDNRRAKNPPKQPPRPPSSRPLRNKKQERAKK